MVISRPRQVLGSDGGRRSGACIPCYHVIIIQSFKTTGTEDIFNGRARSTCPQVLWKIATCKLDQLDSAVVLHELQLPPGNRLEALKADRQGQYSIRINDQYRICFDWTDTGPSEVDIVDFH